MPMFLFWTRCPSASASPIPTPITTCRCSPRPGRTPLTVAASVTGPAPLSLAARAVRVMARCDALAEFTEESGRITRPYGAPAAIGARQALTKWMHDAGLETRIDAVGDLCGRLDGSDPGAPALLLGSHFDSV